LQIADYRQEFFWFPQIDLVYTHVMQWRLPTRFGPALQITKTDRPDVLAGMPNRRATWQADALSHASPTVSSKRLLNSALPGSNGTLSTRTPQSGHFTRNTSMNTVV
jgi:hypothetical protein